MSNAGPSDANQSASSLTSLFNDLARSRRNHIFILLKDGRLYNNFITRTGLTSLAKYRSYLFLSVIIELMSRRPKRKKSYIFYIASLSVVLVSSLINFHLWQTNKSQKKTIEKLNQELQTAKEKGLKVVEVTDGDTFIIEGGVRVRLADINAPEKEFCLGKEAKKRLEELVLGKMIRIEFGRPDWFGRTIALIYQGDNWINQIMLAEGLGRYDSTQTIKEKDRQLLAAAHQAEREKRGVYSSQCTQKEPLDPKCSIKGNIDKKRGRKIYHFPGCAGYNVVVVELDRGEQWFCSEKEAQAAGFVKSEQCCGKKWRP